MTWFRMAYSVNAFLRSAGAKPRDIETMRPAAALEAMLRFYREYEPQHGDRDALEFRWGVRESMFELVFARPMHRDDVDERHDLELRLRYPASAERNLAAGGQLGCTDRDDLERFEREVTGTAAWKLTAGEAPESVTLQER